MRFMHLADLHLGKRLGEYSLLDEQAYILDEMLRLAAEDRPDAVLIAGDVYDKPAPSAEAVALFDDFLCALAGRVSHTFVVSGNHDSPERIAFGGRLMDARGIHMSPVYRGRATDAVTLSDEFGEVDVFMLPFVKPAHVRPFFQEEIASYTDAVRVAVAGMPVRAAKRSVLVAHQFVAGATRSDSEEIVVGGLDSVDASALDAFDYVALGHIHRSQQVSRPTLRYAGAPLKYSVAEAGQDKSVTLVEMGAKGDVRVRETPLSPRHDLRRIRGSFAEIAAGAASEDFLHVVLTDEDDVPDVMGKLRTVYPNILRLDYDNARTRGMARVGAANVPEKKSEMALFDELYQIQNNRPMSAEQASYMERIVREAREAEICGL